ncbi:MAG: FAD-dependent oxidoreductase [Sphingobacteriaceae bacterium]|nr:MAG: FAD-dependent oxidoreductase [Sphingobacteriaceae bacterium]
MPKFKKQYRSPLINALRKAFFISKEAQKTGSASTDSLIDSFLQSKIQRRQFVAGVVKTGIVMTTAGLLSACEKIADFVPAAPDGNIGTGSKKKQPKIVVIGAGMAGLNCAYQLKKAGYMAAVYEGSKRIGGRIFTESEVVATDLYTELGGEFIDSEHQDMLQLCSEFGLQLLDTRTQAEEKLARDSFYIDGRFYTEKEVIKAFMPYASRISADIDSLPDEITFDNYDEASKHFDSMSVKGYLDGIGMSGFIRKGIETAYLTEYGLDTDEQSAINFLYLFNPDTSDGFEIFGSSDERYKIKGGNSSLTAKLFEQVKNQVQLENILVKIQQTVAGYTLYFSNGTDSLTAVYADIVVCKWKTDAIEKLGYGTNSKLLLGFSSRVWRKYGNSGYVFTNSVIQNGWDNSWAQSGQNGGFTIYQGGTEGLRLGDGTPEFQAPKFLEQLDKMWPGCKAAFNGRVKRMHWPAYPFTKGSYACYKVGQYTGIRGAERRPVGNLHFAGEHCSLEFQGFMNGAAETGRMAAAEILAKMNS